MAATESAGDGIAHKAGSGLLPMARGWKFEDAGTHFSEIVRLACSEGPQRIAVLGKEAVFVISADELQRLLPFERKGPLVAFLEGLHLDSVDTMRKPDNGRTIAF